MKFGLKEKDIDTINSVFTQFEAIEEAVIYGSRAKGNYKPASDIDITLKGKNMDSTLLNKVAIQLDDLLLPYTFDLSIFDHISNPDLADHIKRVGITFFHKHH